MPEADEWIAPSEIQKFCPVLLNMARTNASVLDWPAADVGCAIKEEVLNCKSGELLQAILAAVLLLAFEPGRATYLACGPVLAGGEGLF